MYEITNEEFTKLVAESKNWTDLAIRCGIKRNSFGTLDCSPKSDLKLKVNILGLDTSHFWKKHNNRHHTQLLRRKIPNEEIFVADSSFDATSIKKHLIQMGWKNECVACKNMHFDEKDGVVLWQGKELILQLEHRNGNNTDNRLENLELLCPLCHSQTSTYCRRNSLRVRGKPTREAVDDLELTERIRECNSWKSVCTYGGGDYTMTFACEFKRRATALGLDFSHFVERGHTRIPDEAFFVSYTKRKGTCTKQRLFDLGWPNECASCKNIFFVDIGGIPHWMDKEIVLHVEHKNGVHSDNRLDNIELLCYNCHSQTDTFSGRNRKRCITKRKWLSDGI